MAALLVVLAGCGGGSREPAAAAGAGLVDAHAALCEAVAEPAQARALFFDRSHDALHEVARRLEDVDRTQAAQLLQAKERVESGFAPPREELSGDLRTLADVYRSALGRLAITAPPCD